MMKTALSTVLCAALALTACAGKPKVDDVDLGDENESNVPQGFQQGLAALEKEQYAEAARIFDRLLVAKPATELDLVTLYNSGAAYEGMGECKTAADRYRSVVRSSAGRFRQIEAQTFFRLSLMYECLGQNVKAISALIDARKRGKELSQTTAQAEIPARLAAAYARIGNRAKALEYFAIANKGLKRILATETGRKQQELLARTLFLMGQLNPGQRKGEGDPKAFLLGLGMQQPYLLQAVEIGHVVWSKRAAEDLILAYENIWKFPVADREAQNEYFTRALQVARELQKIRLPGKSDALLDDVFARVERAESRIQGELARLPEATQLTPEAKKREGLKREGRLVTPAPGTAKPGKAKRQ